MLKIQTGFGGSYNANSSKLILSEVMKEHGQQAVDDSASSSSNESSASGRARVSNAGSR